MISATGHCASQLTSLYLGKACAAPVTATVRLLAMPDGEDRYFHRAACAFAWLMILVSTPFELSEHICGADRRQTGRSGVDDPVPGRGGDGLLEGESMAAPKQQEKHRSWGAMVVQPKLPVFFTLCVLLLGAHTARRRPVRGLQRWSARYLIYTFRATILPDQAAPGAGKPE